MQEEPSHNAMNVSRLESYVAVIVCVSCVTLIYPLLRTASVV
jgi:hypothetical protein